MESHLVPEAGREAHIRVNHLTWGWAIYTQYPFKFLTKLYSTAENTLTLSSEFLPNCMASGMKIRYMLPTKNLIQF